MICPSTMKPCCDDICRGGGCLALGGGEEPLTRCGGPGNCLVTMTGNHDVFRCECYEDDFEYMGTGETCWACHGEGGSHDCGEDTCCCLDKGEITHECDECQGYGYL